MFSEIAVQVSRSTGRLGSEKCRAYRGGRSGPDGRPSTNGIKVTAQGGNVLCHGAMVFANGQVEIQGETDFHEPFTVGVVGGTGAYQNAGGQITVERTLSDGTSDVETLRLIFFETR
jgi:uncharacterized protein (AIM24 family)